MPRAPFCICQSDSHVPASHARFTHLPPCALLPPPPFQPRWSEQAEELLGLIVDSLRALEGAVPQAPPYPDTPLRRRPHSARKMAVVLAHAPPAFQSEIVALVPRRVAPQEHCEAAAVLLQRLGHTGVDPMVQLPVRGGGRGGGREGGRERLREGGRGRGREGGRG